jgi:Uma2 family endonuclease
MTTVVLAPPVQEMTPSIPELTPTIETIAYQPHADDRNSAQIKPRHSSEPIIYPESDGKPMAENTKQFETLVTIQGGIAADHADDPNVFVAGDLLWYPVEGDNHTRAAPDVLVAMGRPKGHRGSYLQWKEDNIPPQVVFEILSPGNTVIEMARKFQFYQRYGVEEY